MNSKNFLLITVIIIGCNLLSAKATFTWKEGGPVFATYMTITGKTGFITTPSAFCAPMGMLMIGFEHTMSSRIWHGQVAIINKITFTPHWMFEFGFSKALGYTDVPSPVTFTNPINGVSNTYPGHYFDSTPYMLHFKVRILNWENGAIAIVQDFDYVPDDSGQASRGLSSTTIGVFFTGLTTLVGSFNFGFGKTFYFLHTPDLLFNFYVSWVYSFAQLDHRLQLLIDFSNADYQAGADEYKIAHEDRGYLNFQIRGVPVKTARFQWTLTFTLYDILDMGGRPYANPTPGPYDPNFNYVVNFNCGIGTSFNIDLF
jgi:hypothetical protein